VDILGIQIPKERNDLTPINVYRKLAITIATMEKENTCQFLEKSSLVISQFTYLLMVLPTPSDVLFKLYEQEILNLIWNGMSDKIKRAYEFGGQK
jgi:hypothetical protein